MNFRDIGDEFAFTVLAAWNGEQEHAPLEYWRKWLASIGLEMPGWIKSRNFGKRSG